MLVNRRNPRDAELSLTQSTDCYYCGSPLQEVFIEWHGSHSGEDVYDVIAMHPRCTIELCIRLMRDVHEHECNSHQVVRLMFEK